jgi:hypothetical protein
MAVMTLIMLMMVQGSGFLMTLMTLLTLVMLIRRMTLMTLMAVMTLIMLMMVQGSGFLMTPMTPMTLVTLMGFIIPAALRPVILSAAPTNCGAWGLGFRLGFRLMITGVVV